MRPEKQRKNYQKKTDDEYKKLYAIHHMHHFQSGKNVKHELHHCFLFEKKNMGGKKFLIVHKRNKSDLFHCILGNFDGKLYDHANNAYIIGKKIINGRGISEIKI